MPLDSARAAWGFLAENGRRLLETSLPSWGPVDVWNPATVSWPLPFLGLGLVWLLLRRSTRFLGLIVVAFGAAVVVASALHVYPLGMGRPDIFAFPVVICLFAAGIHFVSDPFRRRRAFRLAAATAVAAFAVARPLHVEYWDVNDVHLVDALAADLRPDDALIVSPSGAALIAFYGPWPVTITATDRNTHGTLPTIGHDQTQYLFGGSQGALVTQFLADLRPTRAWYVAFRTGRDAAAVIDAIEGLGYAVHKVQDTRMGKLYLALADHAVRAP